MSDCSQSKPLKNLHYQIQQTHYEKKNVVVLLLQQHIQQKNKKQGSTNLNPLRAFWNSRCAILHLISTNSHCANKIKKHRAYQNC